MRGAAGPSAHAALEPYCISTPSTSPSHCGGRRSPTPSPSGCLHRVHARHRGVHRRHGDVGRADVRVHGVEPPVLLDEEASADGREHLAAVDVERGDGVLLDPLVSYANPRRVWSL